MALQRVTIKPSDRIKAFLLHEPKRSMSNTKLAVTAFVWMFAIIMVYSSFFYAPAYYDFKNAFGIANTKSINTKSAPKSIISPYIDLMKQNRAFLKKGQGMEVVYAFSPGVKAELVLYKCQSPVVVEVFKCNPVVINSKRMRRRKGRHIVKVKDSGFYAFDVVVSDKEKKKPRTWRG